MKWEPRAEGWNLIYNGEVVGMIRPVEVGATDEAQLFVGTVRGRYPPRTEVAHHTNPAIVRQAVWDEVKRMVIAEAVDMLSDDDDVPQAGPG